jgi:lysophospholipase L1-like esterase
VEVWDNLGRPIWVEQSPEPMTPALLAADAQKAVPRHMANFRLSRDSLEALTRLVRLIESDGARVVFIEYPVSDAYRQLVQSRFAAQDRLWRAELDRRFPRQERLSFEDDAALRQPENLIDADHLSVQGAIDLASRLAAKIEAIARAQWGGAAEGGSASQRVMLPPPER